MEGNLFAPFLLLGVGRTLEKKYAPGAWGRDYMYLVMVGMNYEEENTGIVIENHSGKILSSN